MNKVVNKHYCIPFVSYWNQKKEWYQKTKLYKGGLYGKKYMIRQLKELKKIQSNNMISYSHKQLRINYLVLISSNQITNQTTTRLVLILTILLFPLITKCFN